MFKINPIIAIDSYKLGHMSQYPEGTTKVYANLTARNFKWFQNDKIKKYFDEKAVVFGVQAAFQEIVELFREEFFSKDINILMEEFKLNIRPFIGDNSDKLIVQKFRQLHELGYLPLRVKSLTEGTGVRQNIPMMVITNTHPDFAWLVLYLETFISSQTWKLSTAATTAKLYKNICNHYAKKTGTPLESVDFQCHDFSSRGMSGYADSVRTGSGHLTSFKGSDSVQTVNYIRQYYGCTSLVAASVVATEHSVMTMGGKEKEIDTFRRLFKMYPAGIVSIVSDSWDYWNTITNIASELKDEIMNREKDSSGFSKVVFRPDSGNPVDIICGTVNTKEVQSKNEALEIIADRVRDSTPHGEKGEDGVCEIFLFRGKYYEFHVQIDWNRYDKQYYYIDYYQLVDVHEVELDCVQKGSVETLWEIFGGTINKKGYKVLDEHVGLIYGDSITPDRADEILDKLEKKGFASNNIIFGIGSYTFNFSTRDTLGFAMKATYGEINGKGIKIFKDPKTDS